MNVYLLIAAILTVLTAGVHSVVGEKLIISPLMKSRDLPTISGSVWIVRKTLRFAWHLTTVLGIGIAAILFYYAGIETLGPEQVVIVKILSATFFASFLVSLIGARGRHPSWVAFLLAAGLTWLGA